jgi:hypothetical protein
MAARVIIPGDVYMNFVKHMMRTALCIAVVACLVNVSFAGAQKTPADSDTAPKTQVWRFDNTASIDGYKTTALGHPQVIGTPYGKAVAFNGVDDALFIDDHPLAGVTAYTWEVIFRPDAGGAQAQRFFHLQEQNPLTGANTQNRMLFELRIVDGQWCLDSFATSAGQSRTLLNCTPSGLHPLGKWYRITAVYDGKELKNYVDDDLQGAGPVFLAPQGPGHSSVGTRIDKRDYFKGAVYSARMTPRALTQAEFLKMPPINTESK